MFRLLLPTPQRPAGDGATPAACPESDTHDAFRGITNATIIAPVMWLAALAVWLLSAWL